MNEDHDRFQIWTIQDAARYLRTDPTVCRKLLREGLFPPPFFLDREPLWRKADILAFIDVMARESWRQQVTQERATVTTRGGGSDVPAPGYAGTLPPCLLPVQGELLPGCGCPAVYFLFQDSGVVYVGSSINPLRRIREHAAGSDKTPRKDFNGVLCLPVPLQEMIETEKKFVALLDPPLNINLKPKATAGRPEPATNGEMAP